MACLSCLVVLGACGGDDPGGGDGGRAGGLADIEADSGPGESPSGPVGGDTGVSGQVLDAVTGVAIPGVDVRLARASTNGDGAAGSAVAIALTLADGRYAFDDLPAAVYVAAFDVEGYRNESHSGIVPDDTGDAMLEPVRLVSDDNAGAGHLAGRLVGVADGSGLANLTLDFRAGINRREGEVIATARTSADGRYRVDGLGHGNVTAEIRGEGFRTAYATFQVLGNMLRTGQDVAVAAADAGGEPADVDALRVVLTWDERPHDLDAHLTGPESDGQAYFHVFSGDREAGAARLVDDATMGSGPEIIEIGRRESGVHRYSVFNFSGDVDRPLEQSGARVEVFSGDASLAAFAVPAGVGNLWTVFDIDGGRIVAVNAVTRLRNVLDHFPPPGRALAFDAAVASGAIAPDAGGRSRDP